MKSEPLLKQNKKPIIVRDMNNFDQKAFTKELHDLQLYEQIKSSDNSNTAYNIFHKHFLALLNIHAPFKCLSKREINIKQKPWDLNIDQHQKEALQKIHKIQRK